MTHSSLSDLDPDSAGLLEVLVRAASGLCPNEGGRGGGGVRGEGAKEGKTRATAYHQSCPAILRLRDL